MATEQSKYFLVCLTEGANKERVVGSAHTVMELENDLVEFERFCTVLSSRIVKGTQLKSSEYKTFRPSTFTPRQVELIQ